MSTGGHERARAAPPDSPSPAPKRPRTQKSRKNLQEDHLSDSELSSVSTISTTSEELSGGGHTQGLSDAIRKALLQENMAMNNMHPAADDCTTAAPHSNENIDNPFVISGSNLGIAQPGNLTDGAQHMTRITTQTEDVPAERAGNYRSQILHGGEPETNLVLQPQAAPRELTPAVVAPALPTAVTAAVSKEPAHVATGPGLQQPTLDAARVSLAAAPALVEHPAPAVVPAPIQQPAPAVVVPPLQQRAPAAPPVPQQALVTTKTRPYMTADLVRRCNTLLTFSNEEKAYYSVRSFNKDNAEWGPKTTGAINKSQYLCRKTDHSLITFWILGEVERTYFATKEGQPPRKPGINVVPLLSEDMDHARAIVREFSNPRLGSVFEEDIWVSRWQTSKTGTNAADWFRRTYDATRTLRNKSAMKIIDPNHLHRGDLVLVEAYLNRYTPTDGSNTEGTPRKYQRQAPGWTHWIAQFELLAISHIFVVDPQSEDDGLDLEI